MSKSPALQPCVDGAL